jgi:hypothetical protein
VPASKENIIIFLLCNVYQLKIIIGLPRNICDEPFKNQFKPFFQPLASCKKYRSSPILLALHEPSAFAYTISIRGKTKNLSRLNRYHSCALRNRLSFLITSLLIYLAFEAFKTAESLLRSIPDAYPFYRITQAPGCQRFLRLKSLVILAMSQPSATRLRAYRKIPSVAMLQQCLLGLLRANLRDFHKP